MLALHYHAKMSADEIIDHLTNAALAQTGLELMHGGAIEHRRHHLRGGNLDAFEGVHEPFEGGRLRHHRIHHVGMHGDGFFSSLRDGARNVYKFASGAVHSIASNPIVRTAGNQLLRQGQDALVSKIRAL